MASFGKVRVSKVMRSWRWILRRPCEICGDRRRCWRWHVEVLRCPTCHTDITEFHPRASKVALAMFHNGEQGITITGTSSSNVTITECSTRPFPLV